MAEHQLPDNNRQSAPLRMRGATLRLLGGFELSVNGVVIDVPLPSQRLLAYLALQPRPRARALVRAALACHLGMATFEAAAVSGRADG